ncbi:MAG: 1-acyl-sn-glycerol-3-phosphate acyltransferase [Chlamydiota bacterium]
MDYRAKLSHYAATNQIPPHYAKVIGGFFDSYEKIIAVKGENIDDYAELLTTYLELVKSQIIEPYRFKPFHNMVTTPFNYHAFSNRLINPLINTKESQLINPDILTKVEEQLGRGENVFLLANHQSEAEPQAISALWGKRYQQLADQMIYIAGDRVTTDPLAAPLSQGSNLLCIYSKRHIDRPPEKRQEKLLHNQKALKTLTELLSDGGKLIYVAPSGGRDRPSPSGQIDVPPFDPDSLEMMRLVTQKSQTSTHFYPLALATYDFLPPPDTIHNPLGEKRNFSYSGVGIALGEEIDFDHPPASGDKKTQRQARADQAWQKVKQLYEQLRG